MATNLAGGGVCIAEHSVCIIRLAKLDTDCSPLGGADSGIVTDAIVTLTADPDIEEGTLLEPKLGCGSIGVTVSEPDVIKRYNLSGELLYHSPEVDHILFPGSTIIVGGAGSDFATDNIGWAAPTIAQAAAATNGIYLEVISKTAGRAVGTCSSGGVPLPYAVGHIFGKVVTTPGSLNFASAEIRNLTFTGKASENPSLFNGPWNDWPGTAYIRDSAYQYIQYSRDEYDAISVLASCGYQTLPAAS